MPQPKTKSRFHFLRLGSDCLRAAAGAMILIFSAATALPQDDDASKAQIAEATNHLGKWVWDQRTYDKQTVHFWNSFVIPRGAVVSNAVLYITADNSYQLLLDGREIGRGSDWKTLTEYDLKYLLPPGEHVLAVEAFNDRLAGGLMFGMQIDMAGGKAIEMFSDDSWKIIPPEEKDWENIRHPPANWASAVVVGGVGEAPWTPWPYAVASVPPLQPLTVHFWQTLWFQITLLSALGTVVLICLWLLAQLAAQSKAQRLLNLQRARIARDIHDDLGVRLTQLVLLGELAQNELPEQSETRAQIDRICEQARELGCAMDEVVWAVSSRRDTLRDFAAFVCKYAQLFLQNTPIRCRFDVESELPPTPFDLAIRRNLLLAVKEAINNAAKHSGASELFLRIHRRGGGVYVAVEDNGAGFDVSQADWMRNGLTNMAQRMDEVGGKFTVNSAPGFGCRIEFNLPLTHARQRPRWLKWFSRGPEQPDETEHPPLTIPVEMEATGGNPQ
jgi:signal transduction histidine kinase